MSKRNRKRNVVADWLAYAGVRVGLFIMYRFSVKANLRFACFLGDQMWKNYHRGRKRAIDNLKASFPDKGDEWIETTGHRSFQQIAMLVIDTLFTPRLVHRDNWDQYSTYKNIEEVKWMMQGGQPVMFVGAHYGNFEIVGYLLGLFGFDVYSIARPLDNKFINDYLFGVRERTGQKIIDKKGATEKMEQIMKERSTLCFIADQDAGRKGVFVDFFGRKASTYKSIGLLAMQYEMPIAVGYSRRIGDDFFFEICTSRIIMPAEWKDKDDPLFWITQEYTAEIEKFVREDPSQYWWLHRRWKHRPREERKRARGAGEGK
jgi:KDO2-lipid IV(A) lauroyltransferase